MINKYAAKQYCCEDISLIENYELAIKDDVKYVCHHRLEIELHLRQKQLKELDLYYNRPASELIFLTDIEHKKLHAAGEYNTMYGNGDKLKGEKNGMYGVRRYGEEAPAYGKIWINNGKIQTYIKPEELDKYLENGFKRGTLKYKFLKPNNETVIATNLILYYHPDYVCLGPVDTL